MCNFCGFVANGLWLLKLGTLANFVPTNVILGLLVAIGLILIINQLPNLFGLHMATVKDLGIQGIPQLLQHVDVGAALIGVLSVALILLWDQNAFKEVTIAISTDCSRLCRGAELDLDSDRFKFGCG